MGYWDFKVPENNKIVLNGWCKAFFSQVLLFALSFTWGLGNRTFLALGSKGETNTFGNEKCCTDGWTFAISTLCETALSKSYHLLWSLDTLVKPCCTGRYRWFLDGLWILVMPWSKVLIEHKELGWKLPYNTIGKKHKSDRYVKEGKGGTLQSVRSCLWTQSYPPNFFEVVLHFKGALCQLHCESSLVLLQSFWKQGSKITSSLHHILNPNPWKMKILDYRDELFQSMYALHSLTQMTLHLWSHTLNYIILYVQMGIELRLVCSLSLFPLPPPRESNKLWCFGVRV